MPINCPNNNIISGARYMFEGARLLMHPKLRPYILVPLLINCLLFFVLTSVLLSYFWTVFNEGTGWIPESIQPWVEPFAWFVWFIVGVFFLIIYGYSFNVITNIVAAPFYGLLAENTEKLLTGTEPPPESLGRMIPRVLMREFSKLLYFLGRGFLVILLMIMLGFIPVIQLLAPLIGMLWGAWSMAIQYADYPADNHQVRFSHMRLSLWNRMGSSLGFGSCIMTCSVIPIVNIFAMPAAVTGGTLFWLKELNEQVELDSNK
ncbi:sulfate transporter CysZ [Agaribacterium sp. ZY112]|uniref:sulfate transporter CysZ n=1 Tax=Agaribacterium sp. ZY112 TaxID=3233574 RepID=UPI0035258840